MSIEAMKQALEDICAAKLCEFNSMSSRHEMLRLMDNAITALRQALETEPFEYWSVADGWVKIEDTERVDETAKQEHDPVAWASSLDFDDDDQEIISAKHKGKLGTSNCDIPLYTAPQKQWVGLTLNEAEDFYEKYTDRAELINAIDKFLEEKNA